MAENTKPATLWGKEKSLHSRQWRSTAPLRWRHMSGRLRSARPRSPPGRWRHFPPTSPSYLQRRGGEKKSSREKSIYWMERVCLVSAAPSGPSGQRKWNDITQPHSHTTHYYIASGVGHLYEQCALIHYAGRQCKRKEQVFPFWDVKKEEETLRATSVGFQRAQSSAGFHVRHLNRG